MGGSGSKVYLIYERLGLKMRGKIEREKTRLKDMKDESMGGMDFSRAWVGWMLSFSIPS